MCTFECTCVYVCAFGIGGNQFENAHVLFALSITFVYILYASENLQHFPHFSIHQRVSISLSFALLLGLALNGLVENAC